MSLNSSTITKFFRECFNGRNPIVVTGDNRASFIEMMKAQLTGLNHIALEQRSYLADKEKDRLLLAFTVVDPLDHYYGGNTCRFKIDEQGLLTIRAEGESALVSSLDEVLAFIAACQERLARRQAQRGKRSRVRNLKEQAVVAQIKKLAKENAFDFCVQTDTQKIKLFVEFPKTGSAESECFVIYIYHRQYQEMLPKLAKAIGALQQLHEDGIHYRVRSPRYCHSADWIRHQDL